MAELRAVVVRLTHQHSLITAQSGRGEGFILHDLEPDHVLQGNVLQLVLLQTGRQLRDVARNV